MGQLATLTNRGFKRVGSYYNNRLREDTFHRVLVLPLSKTNNPILPTDKAIFAYSPATRQVTAFHAVMLGNFPALLCVSLRTAPVIHGLKSTRSSYHRD